MRSVLRCVVSAGVAATLLIDWLTDASRFGTAVPTAAVLLERRQADAGRSDPGHDGHVP